jgi:hypothetical protein
VIVRSRQTGEVFGAQRRRAGDRAGCRSPRAARLSRERREVARAVRRDAERLGHGCFAVLERDQTHALEGLHGTRARRSARRHSAMTRARSRHGRDVRLVLRDARTLVYGDVAGVRGRIDRWPAKRVEMVRSAVLVLSLHLRTHVVGGQNSP